MANLCDRVERHLQLLLDQGRGQPLAIQRRELAARFACAPSQISYVLETRFTLECGYAVETRRGRHGYIRIYRLIFDSPSDLLRSTYQAVGEALNPATAHHLVARLHDRGMLNRREAELMKAATAEGAADIKDSVRARLLRSMLLCLLREGARGGSSGHSAGLP
ncbi:MAG TPA: transcriptional regulator [Clostridiales bacterium]|nr:transcriptional regulator [Clostridiales bacterium]